MRILVRLLAGAVSACGARPPVVAPPKEPPVVLVPPAPPGSASRQHSPRQPASPRDADLAGAWGGWLSEGITYQVCMEIPADLGREGVVAYFDGLECAGTIRHVASDGARHTFVETLLWGTVSQGGNCVDTGRIEVSLNPDGSLAWAWFQIDASTPQVTTTLQKLPECR
ncbi:MAG TPA: hypothetical protein VI197_25350 [Polyangiaceae bacterium]